MQKISNYILNLSSKQLAIYLIIYPLILVLIHTFLTIADCKAYGFTEETNGVIRILILIVSTLLFTVVLLWVLWLRAITLSVDHTALGIPIKWFRRAFGLFLFYLIFNLSYSTLVNIMQNTTDDFTWIARASRETINFVGLLILYPVICHYAARAVYVHKEDKDATFSNSIAFTLLLICIPISIPFLHNYISPVKTKHGVLIKIYAIGFSVVFLIFLVAFFASITGVF